MYKLIAEAESKVHGTTVADVHLHEVGAKDAIIDITAYCLLIDYLQIDKIVCSPIATGLGEAKKGQEIRPAPNNHLRRRRTNPWRTREAQAH